MIPDVAAFQASTARTPLLAHLPHSKCPSCGLETLLGMTADSGTVLLETFDPLAPPTAGEIPPPHRWAANGHFAQQLPDSVDPRTACWIEHTAVCPALPLPIDQPALRARRHLNTERARQARDLHEAGIPEE
ncbi:DUF6083 domain-containing protein [Streptomyces sp. NPDC048717]|uniref:DUF6083 domain-containing protein n=1 Tax=Streptomyces sp. NPDC048717 TaxID=3154928 RepID=UPI0034476981